MQQNKPNISQPVLDLLIDIRNHGGQPLFVGGWVRDFLMDKQSGDIDIEVFRLPLEQLRKLCRKHGHLIMVGASFAVLKLTLSNSQTVDISLPRKERQTGRGHRDFDIHADPFMSVEEAAERRDLTINAISMDPLTGAILDPVNGVSDLKNNILRHVGPRFSEDPLRVLRVYRFQSVTGFDIAPETRIVCQNICASGSLKMLPRERIEEEMRKLILTGKKRATLAALQNMNDDGVIASLFPELERLAEIPQDERFHSEGNVLMHTFMSVVETAGIAHRDKLEPDTAWALSLAALIHDLGKADTTELRSDGSIISHGHEKAGVKSSKKLLDRLTGQIRTKDIALALALNHMRPLNLAKAKKVSDNAIRRLAVAVEPASIELLAKLVEADTAASIRKDGSDPENAHLFLLNRATRLGINKHPPKPLVLGRDLMMLAGKGELPKAFATGGPHYSNILKKTYQAQLNGKFSNKHDALNYIKTQFKNDSCV